MTMHPLIALFRYDRDALGHGEYWRLVSAHVVHLTFLHAALNAAAAILLWKLFRRDYSARQWLFVIAICVCAIDAGLWLLDPQISWYVGASGVLHGVFAAGTLSWLMQRRREAWLLAVLLMIKVAFEQMNGTPVFANEFPVVINAHLYGAVGGLAAALVIRLNAKGAES